jgi:hypothetical protein
LFKPVLRCNSHDTIITLLLNWLVFLGTANSLQPPFGYSSTAWRRVLPEKLTGPLLVKNFPPFYGTLVLSWGISIVALSIVALSIVGPTDYPHRMHQRIAA